MLKQLAYMRFIPKADPPSNENPFITWANCKSTRSAPERPALGLLYLPMETCHATPNR